MTENKVSNNSMIFFASIKESIDVLDVSDALKVEYYEGIVNYGLFGIIPHFSDPALNAIFIALKPNIDANTRKKLQAIRCAENGRKGGAPKNNTNACKSTAKKTKTTQKTTPKTTIDVDVDVDVDVDADVDVDVEKETKDISFISSSSSKEKKEKESKKTFLSKDDVQGKELSEAGQVVEPLPEVNNEIVSLPEAGQEEVASSSSPDKNTSTSLHERDVLFYKSLISFAKDYAADALQDFYDYWTEPDAAGLHLRFELEKTWDMGYRLERWMKKRRMLNLL